MTTDRRQFLLATMAAIGCAEPLLCAASAPAIRMAYYENYPPFSVRDADGRMVGALIDGVEIVGRIANLVFEHQGYPWARAQAMVESGALDGFCTTNIPTRRAYADFCSTPILIERFGVFHRANDKRILNIHSLKDFRAFNQGRYFGGGYPLAHLVLVKVTAAGKQ